MIQINLLPPELRVVARDRAGPAVPWKPAARAVGGGVIALTVALVLFNGWQGRSLRRLQAEWRRLEPEKVRLDQTQQDIRALQLQAESLQRIKEPAGQWAPRLNLLSDVVVPQIWFSSLKWSQGQPARLEGSALAASDADRSAPVTQFLQRLKEHPDFSRWFSSVELLSVAHRKVGDAEVVDFTVLLNP